MKWAVQRFDPVYHATKLHFDDLASRYGNPVIVLSLIKVDNLTHSYDSLNAHVRSNVYHNYDILQMSLTVFSGHPLT